MSSQFAPGFWYSRELGERAVNHANPKQIPASLAYICAPIFLVPMLRTYGFDSPKTVEGLHWTFLALDFSQDL